MDYQLELELKKELAEQKKALSFSIAQSFKKGTAEAIAVSTRNFGKFDVLKDYPGFVLSDNYTVSKGKSAIRLFFVDTKSIFKAPKNGTIEFLDMFCFCAFPVKTNFGRSIIRTETILDKIAEIFIPCEHDFDEFPKFSFQYSCFSNEPDNLRAALNASIAELFTNYENEISVEFGYNLCVLKHKFSIKEKDRAIELIDFSLRLAEIIK